MRRFLVSDGQLMLTVESACSKKFVLTRFESRNMYLWIMELDFSCLKFLCDFLAMIS